MTDRPTHKDENGYLRFSDNHQLVHRAVAELKIGRRLSPTEVVHHIDMDKLNNDPSNLRVCKDQAEHEQIHGGVYRPKNDTLATLFMLLVLVASIGALGVVWVMVQLSGMGSAICALPPAILIVLMFWGLDKQRKQA